MHVNFVAMMEIMWLNLLMIRYAMGFSDVTLRNCNQSVTAGAQMSALSRKIEADTIKVSILYFDPESVMNVSLVNKASKTVTTPTFLVSLVDVHVVTATPSPRFKKLTELQHVDVCFDAESYIRRFLVYLL